MIIRRHQTMLVAGEAWFSDCETYRHRRGARQMGLFA